MAPPTRGSSSGYGDGTVFQITPTGTLTTLHTLGGADGSLPSAGLLEGAGGEFFGATSSGALCCGTIFKISAGGTFNTLHRFSGPDGNAPFFGLIQTPNGNLFGTTTHGGPTDSGTVYGMTPDGTLTTLYSFAGPDGAEPNGLVLASGGNFYGTTENGGAFGDGAVFKITPAGALTTLHQFNQTDGYFPSTLIHATDGNFYGVTQSGGAHNNGTIFMITPAGAFTMLYSFHGTTDGNAPGAPLVQATDGNFYGTTLAGGARNNRCGGCGTIFRLSMGLAPFVKLLPYSGAVGDTVQILGTNLTGATSVTFNGIAATFTLTSPTLITAAVPSGVTTGQVQVTTPAGTLLSNTTFVVLP